MFESFYCSSFVIFAAGTSKYDKRMQREKNKELRWGWAATKQMECVGGTGDLYAGRKNTAYIFQYLNQLIL